jgi:hypothetical protein
MFEARAANLADGALITRHRTAMFQAIERLRTQLRLRRSGDTFNSRV